jgi:hypothetical protein
MNADAVIIQMPSTDFQTLLGLSQPALGRSLAEEADASSIDLSDTERFLACLASLQCGPITSRLFAHVSFSLLVAAEERDMLDILQVAGMPFALGETLQRGTQLAVVTGTLAQWRAAVEAGSVKDSQANIRAFFNRVQGLFEARRIGAWKDFDQHQLPDRTLYLTHKR